MKILKAKLAVLAEEQHKDTIDELRGPSVENAWGNQIRSYVLHPYTMVKDSRSSYSSTDVAAVLDGELDEQRVEQEIVLFAQKVDAAEELDRLDAHITEVRRVLASDKPIGRRLDFLMQELNREANTLASKSADAETTRAAVDLKVSIEQMREQVQNVE